MSRYRIAMSWEGTDKQVGWARGIRRTLTARLLSYDISGAVRMLLPGFTGAQVRTARDPRTELRQRFHYACRLIPRVTDTRWLIEHRDDEPAVLFNVLDRYTGPTA